MQDIIPIFTSNFNGSQTQSIDARKLHEFLEVKTKFADWVQRKIKKHRFLENIDFTRISQNRETSSGGTVVIEYHFSTDMAKQISMLEDNAKGDEARLYFIAKEKQANNLMQIQAPKIDSQFLLRISQEMAEKEQLIERQQITIGTLEVENTQKQETIEVQEKTIFEISNIQDTYSLREASKNLIVGERQLQEYLKLKKWWIYLSNGEESKKMYSTSYSKDNNFAIDKKVLNKGRQKFYQQFRITRHGMDFLIKRREEILKQK